MKPVFRNRQSMHVGLRGNDITVNVWLVIASAILLCAGFSGQIQGTTEIRPETGGLRFFILTLPSTAILLPEVLI